MKGLCTYKDICHPLLKQQFLYHIAGKIGFITIKGKTTGFSREEFEYEIPVEDAEILLKNAKMFP